MLSPQPKAITDRRARAERLLPRAVVVLFGSLAPLVFSGCQSLDATSAAGAAQVRFVNTSRNAGDVDLYMNGTGAAYNLGFASFTTYVPFAPGSYSLHAARVNTAQILVSAHAALAPGHAYTAVMTHPLSGLTEALYDDQITPASPNTIAVRVLDEADELGPVDVYVKPVANAGSARGPLAAGLRDGANSGYLELPAAAGSYTVSVVPAGAPPSGSGSLVLATASLEAAPGAVRTLVLANHPVKAGGVYAFVLSDLEPS